MQNNPNRVRAYAIRSSHYNALICDLSRSILCTIYCYLLFSVCTIYASTILNDFEHNVAVRIKYSNLQFLHLISMYSFRYIRRNQLDAGFPLFETESLKWPGFVEFDDVNGKVLTYSAQDGYTFLNIDCIMMCTSQHLLI